MAFSFENLIAYQRALDLADKCETLLEQSTRGFTLAQRNQLSRASMSVALNIAEGNGRWHKAEKRNFFWIARGSVFECAAIMQILRRRNKISDEEYQDFYCCLEEIGKLLTGLVKSIEKLQSNWHRTSSSTLE